MVVARIHSERLWTATEAPGIGERQCKSAASSGLGIRQSLGRRSLECDPAVCWVSGSGGSAMNSDVAVMVAPGIGGHGGIFDVVDLKPQLHVSSSGNLVVKRSVSSSVVV
ncbi:hypothetical protein FH972_015003 [Carpinus fangiana]|uniref:Uncharacterized protein n=1 Tax=Carpinus fangiana TaxID=176857 RepID=A0A5N6RD82_9ROSI|nr:hypothetical protein FH972_015003 [Carpinus fangiana]